jgi:hypothetical protein
MRMKSGSRTYWLIRRERLEDLPAPVLLDLLRYDGARVENNSPERFWMFSSDFATAPHEPRMSSFGFGPDFIGKDAQACIEWARKRQEKLSAA